MPYRLSHVVIALIVLVAAVLARSALFIVPEGRQALVFQFGRIVGEPRAEAGLYFKYPFIQDVQYLEKRILNWDGIPELVPTRDKKYITVDTTARWQIINPLTFRNSLENARRAQSRIKNIIDSATRDVISGHNLVEAVRNTNAILERIEKRKTERERAEAAGELDLVEEEITGEIASVTVGREQLSQKIINIARPRLKDYGISLIDVQLRRIAYEESVEEKVYDRMISERQRIADKIRAVGKGEQAKIKGKISEELQKIQSEAYRRVQEIQGKADADAIRIYAEAIGKNEDLYEFLRTIEMYQEGLRGDTKMILSSDSAFFKLFTEGVKRN